MKRHHFVQGHVTVKCTASIYTEYFESNSLRLPGVGLGEKALGISGRTGGKKLWLPFWCYAYWKNDLYIYIYIYAVSII